MYPAPPASHGPRNDYRILLACLVLMLLALAVGLRMVSGGLNSASAPATVQAPAVALATPASAATPTGSVVAASPSAAATPDVVDVDLKELAAAPAAYRSRRISVQGRIFFTGKTEDGKTWVQIVNDSNVFVDGSLAGPLPAGLTKDTKVQITGIGAGLTSITASNGNDYDQPYIDPIERIEAVAE